MEWGFVANMSPCFRHADITLVDNILCSYRQRTGNIILVSDVLCYRKVQCSTSLGVNAEGRRVVVCGSGNAATRAAMPPAPPTSPPPQSPRSPASPRTPPLPVAPSLSLSVSLLTHVDTTDSLKRATRVYYRCKVRFSTIL